MADQLDPLVLATRPIVTIPSGTALIRALLRLVDTGAPQRVRKSAIRMREAALAAQDAWARRSRLLGQRPEINTRAIDARADVAWGAVRGRLASYGSLPADEVPLAARAFELEALLFPEGLTFLRTAYPIQLEHMRLLLRRIDEEKLADDIERIAGREVLAFVRSVQEEYEAMVTAMTLPPEERGDLLQHVAAMSRAIQSYTIQVIAAAENGEVDGVHLLAPLVAHKSQGRPQRSEGVEPIEDLEPEAPLGDAPDAS